MKLWIFEELRLVTLDFPRFEMTSIRNMANTVSSSANLSIRNIATKFSMLLSNLVPKAMRFLNTKRPPELKP